MSDTPSRLAYGTRPPSRLVALIVAVAFFMQLLDGTIISTSLPQIGQSLGVEAVAMSIGITAYMLTMAVFLPVSGWLSDRYGARNIFLCAIIVFSLSSVACGLAQDLQSFVVARAIQGIGGALMTPVGRVLVLRDAPKSELLSLTALLTWPALFAPVIGPVLGGFITTYFSWHWNFFINVPLGIIGLVLTLIHIPAGREAEPRPLDIPGFLLTSTSLACLLYGFESFVHSSSGFLLQAALFAAGIVLGGLAIRHMARAPSPLLDISAFRLPTFAIATIGGGFLVRVALHSTPFLLPLFFQVGFGLSPVETGTLILAYFLGNLGMKAATTPTLRRFGFRAVLVGNGIAIALSIAVFALVTDGTPYPLTLLMLFIAGLVRSMQFTAMMTISFADIDGSQRSSASTLSSMMQQISVVLGVAAGAAMVNAVQAARGAAVPDVFDFRITFLLMAAMSLIGSLSFLRLARDAGAEVAGRLDRP